jgi:hypothetical protein
MMSSMMTKGALTVNGWASLRCVLGVTVEMVDVTKMGDTVAWDPRWIHVDRHGHYHGYSRDGQTPTLRDEFELIDHGCSVYMKTGNCEDHDECWTDRIEWKVCRICGVKVEPGTRVVRIGGEREVVSGRRSASIEVLDVPSSHELAKLIRRDLYRPTMVGDPASALSLFVDAGKVVLEGGKTKHVAYFGQGWCGNAIMLDSGALERVNFTCAFMEEVSYG